MKQDVGFYLHQEGPNLGKTSCPSSPVTIRLDAQFGTPYPRSAGFNTGSCYYTLYLNTYGYSLLFYKVYHEEGECRQLEFWLEKEQILETYSAQLQKS